MPSKANCGSCGHRICDLYFLETGPNQKYHTKCLKCTHCNNNLSAKYSCIWLPDKHVCLDCHKRQYGIKCACCKRWIQSTDWVRRAKTYVYHLACFACDTCRRQLSTGEEFALVENKVLCKLHYIEGLTESPPSNDSADISVESIMTHDEDDFKKRSSRAKRIRTSFTEEQLHILQANFEIDTNPDSAELDRISMLTGLSKRVTQVWFQNSRARQKKISQVSSGRISLVSSPKTETSD